MHRERITSFGCFHLYLACHPCHLIGLLHRHTKSRKAEASLDRKENRLILQKTGQPPFKREGHIKQEGDDNDDVGRRLRLADALDGVLEPPVAGSFRAAYLGSRALAL